MAIHASVKYRSLKAGVIHRRLQLSASIRKAAAAVQQKNVVASISSRQISPSFSFARLMAISNWRNLHLHDIHVNAERTIYPLKDSYAFLDATVFALDNSLSDSFGLLSEPELALVKPQTDSFGMGDNAVLLLDIFREFADSAPVIDTQTFSLGLSKSETLVAADIPSMFVAKTESDVANIGEQAAVVVSKPFEDSAGLSEQFAKSAVFQRVFSDAFVLDDFTDVDAITKDSTAAKNNVIGFSDIQTFVTEKTFQDAVSFAEQSVASFAKGLSDTASLTESIQITMASATSSSVLNASALNTSPLN